MSPSPLKSPSACWRRLLLHLALVTMRVVMYNPLLANSASRLVELSMAFSNVDLVAVIGTQGRHFLNTGEVKPLTWLPHHLGWEWG